MTHNPKAVKFTTNDVEKLANLSRLALNQEEKEEFAIEISGILAYVSQIQDASLLDEHDRTSALKYSLRNVMRADDTEYDSVLVDDPHKLVDLAPSHINGYVQVKKILGSSE